MKPRNPNQRKTRLSIPLRQDTYELLKQMSEEQGFSMASLASQMINTVLQTHKKLYESIETMMTDPQKFIELQKLIAESKDESK